MPVPPNTTFATAKVIDPSALPYTDAQQVDNAGTTYQVYYEITPNFDGLIGVWGSGDLSVYIPSFTVWMADQATVWLHLDSPNPIQHFQTAGRPITVPVVNGQKIYLNFWVIGNPSPANFTLSVLKHQDNLGLAGDFITNREVDTDDELPLTLLAGDSDYLVRKYFNVATPVNGRGTAGLPHGQDGAVLSNGNFLLMEEGNANPGFKVFDKDFNVLNTVTRTQNLYNAAARNDSLQTFYSSDGNIVTEYSSTGVATGKSWNLSPNNVSWMAVNLNSSILYFTNGTGAVAIKRWDLVNNIAMSDLAPSIASTELNDILYLEDDTILAAYLHTGTAPQDVLVKRYDTSGTVLNTYDFGTLWRDSQRPPRIGYALDSPNSFWISLAPNASQQLSYFWNVKISDGSYITQRTHLNYLFGNYIGALTLTPEGRYGADKTFPLLVMPVNQSGVVGTGTITVTKVTSPRGSSQSFTFTGGGLTPTSFTLQDGQSQVFSGLAAGTYSITEDTPGGWETTFTVSNSDPNTAIVINGNSVTVTATNTKLAGIYKLVPGKRNDTLWNSDFTGGIDTAIPDPFAVTAPLGD